FCIILRHSPLFGPKFLYFCRIFAKANLPDTGEVEAHRRMGDDLTEVEAHRWTGDDLTEVEVAPTGG
ncbi:hypothetical protein, partial [Paenibacillus cisolokensis]|uniref:hypothetical protein n=1 Tax=Paenibacillus cisolokensis TaxID=1658519 RepID=UPI001BD0D352